MAGWTWEELWHAVQQVTVHLITQQLCFPSQVCITLNNMEHVREYLSELPQRLAFETVTQWMSIKHEDETVGRKALATLQRLIQR